jgi:hypothetical protein
MSGGIYWKDGERINISLSPPSLDTIYQYIVYLKKLYKSGILRTDELVVVATLRAHQAAVDATKSPQGESAAEALLNQTWPFDIVSTS